MAPLKLTTHPSASDVCGPYFHVYKDVAPLKPFARGEPLGKLFGYFHVYKDVAPLKRRLWRASPTDPSTDFHVYKDVAPLKLLDSWLVHTTIEEFPRLQRRGPIEANIGLVFSRGGILEFPRLQRRGPIEALQFLQLPDWGL